MVKNSMLRGCLVAVLVMCAGSASRAVVEDTEFATADWTETITFEEVGAWLGSVTQEGAGGNPGAFRQFVHVWGIEPGNQTIAVAHILTAQSYDPSVQGAIDTLTCTFDWSPRFDNRGSSGGTGIGLGVALEQDGNVFTAASQTLTEFGPLPGPWMPYSAAGLIESDFVGVSSGGPVTPDFSLGAAVIHFGYLARNGSGFDSVQISHGVDNFNVTIVSASPPRVPGLTPLLSVALVLMFVSSLMFTHRRDHKNTD
jgi:hypothetical protein